MSATKQQSKPTRRPVVNLNDPPTFPILNLISNHNDPVEVEAYNHNRRNWPDDERYYSKRTEDDTRKNNSNIRTL